MVRAPYKCSLDKMEIARAAPSVGSVPAQSSSKRTSERSLTFFKIRMILVIWDEKVLKLCSILCSSPISANTSSNIPSSDRSEAGMWSPDCPIKVRSPTVFKETVLPPVFGPVTIKSLKSLPSVTSIGTTFFLSSSGWRPFLIWRYPSLLNVGATPL